jgi:hypothetical protein
MINMRWTASGRGGGGRWSTLALAVALLPAVGCDRGTSGDEASGTGAEPAREQTRGDRAASTALRATLERATASAAAIEDALRPVPLLRPADEQRLRTHLNDAHVARARALGVRPANEAELRALVDAGRLVLLEPSNQYWIVRQRARDRAYVTPDVPPLLTEIAERFQARLAELDIPPYRLEITSVLRTAAEQAEIRRQNPNAAAGVSSHEFGTTLDIAYESFAPPYPLPEGLVADPPTGMEPELERVAALALEIIGGRKSREMQAFLGHVLIELQNRGDVLVILERLQPVYHITVGRRLAAG